MNFFWVFKPLKTQNNSHNKLSPQQQYPKQSAMKDCSSDEIRNEFYYDTHQINNINKQRTSKNITKKIYQIGYFFLLISRATVAGCYGLSSLSSSSYMSSSLCCDWWILIHLLCVIFDNGKGKQIRDFSE